MVDIKKPIVLNRKKKESIVLEYLISKNRCVTKAELCGLFGWELNSSNDRKIRIIISELSKKEPIISTSNKRGYRIAQEFCDIEDVVHQINENKKRARKILEKNNSLEQFLRNANINWEGQI